MEIIPCALTHLIKEIEWLYGYKVDADKLVTLIADSQKTHIGFIEKNPNLLC